MQQAVCSPLGLIKNTQFYQLLDDPRELRFGDPEQPGEYFDVHYGYVLPRQGVDGDGGFLSVQECVHIGLIGFCRHTGDFDAKGVGAGADLFEQSPVDTHPFGPMRCAKKVQPWVVFG
jgi:hypothetical protein